VHLRGRIILSALLAVLWGILGLSLSATSGDLPAEPIGGERGPTLFGPRRIETHPPALSQAAPQDATQPEYAACEPDETDDEGNRFVLHRGNPFIPPGPNSVRGLRQQPGPPDRHGVARLFLLCRGLMC
jgi:hypothetical protein